MNLTRKQFLASASLLALGAAGLRTLGAEELLNAAGAAAGAPPPPLTPDDVLAILSDAVRPLIGLPIEAGHYRAHFEWRWRQVPGAADAYAAAAQAVDQAARSGANRAFLACGDSEKRQALARAPLPADLRDDVLLLFAETDAWLLAGYDYWPAEARGLDAYRKPPRERA